MHSVQEYIDYADSWQVSEAHELADTGAFDVIYGAGCHCAQPIENYNGTWIIYGLGNTVTVSAPASRIVNNQGVTARIQFAGRKGVAGAWRVSREHAAGLIPVVPDLQRPSQRHMLVRIAGCAGAPAHMERHLFDGRRQERREGVEHHR